MVASKELVGLPHLRLSLKWGLSAIFLLVFGLYSGFPCSSFFIPRYLPQQLFLTVSPTARLQGLTGYWGILSPFVIATGDKSQGEHSLGNCAQ